METHRLEGDWAEDVRQHWPKLSAEDLAAIAGDWDRLIEGLQRRYSLPYEEAAREVDRFCLSMGYANGVTSAESGEPSEA
jgi:hypothetical protein